MTNSKKLLLSACVLFLFGSAACTQVDNTTADTFTELPDPTVDTLSDWSGISAGLHASFVSIDNRFPKSVAPEVTPTETNKLVGWKGEKVSAQLLLWTGEEIEDVQVTITDFQSDNGAKLSNEIAQSRFVRY